MVSPRWMGTKLHRNDSNLEPQTCPYAAHANHQDVKAQTSSTTQPALDKPQTQHSVHIRTATHVIRCHGSTHPKLLESVRGCIQKNIQNVPEHRVENKNKNKDNQKGIVDMFSLTASCIGLVAIAANRSMMIFFPLLLFTSLSFMRRSVMHEHAIYMLPCERKFFNTV